jgi:hypothetical protein
VIIKAAIVEHQQIKPFQSDIVTKTCITHFHCEIEKEFSPLAVPIVEMAKMFMLSCSLTKS